MGAGLAVLDGMSVVLRNNEVAVLDGMSVVLRNNEVVSVKLDNIIVEDASDVGEGEGENCEEIDCPSDKEVDSTTEVTSIIDVDSSSDDVREELNNVNEEVDDSSNNEVDSPSVKDVVNTSNMEEVDGISAGVKVVDISTVVKVDDISAVIKVDNSPNNEDPPSDVIDIDFPTTELVEVVGTISKDDVSSISNENNSVEPLPHSLSQSVD